MRWGVSGLGLLSHGVASGGYSRGWEGTDSGAAGGFFGGLPPSPSAAWWHLAWANNPPGHRESRDWKLKEDEGAPLFVVAVSTAVQRGQDGGTQAAQCTGELAPGELLLVIKRGWRAPGLGAINVGAGNGGAGEREQTVAAI